MSKNLDSNQVFLKVVLVVLYSLLVSIHNIQFTRMTTSQLIEQSINDIQDILNTINSNLIGLPNETYNWKANAESWSILECFEHLNIYNRYYNAALKNAIQKAKNSSPKDNYKSGWFGQMSINMMKPDNKKKQKTLAKFNPANSTLDTSVFDEFIQHQQDLLKMLENAKAINISKNLVPVEFFKLMKMKIGDTFRFVIVHQQRHLQQALRSEK